MDKVIEILKLIYAKIIGVVNKVFGKLDRNNDGQLDAEDFEALAEDVKVDLKALEKKTKNELEELGRKIGVELDKRLTKSKLIQQLKDALED